MSHVVAGHPFPKNKSIAYTYLGRSAVDAALRLEELEGSTVMLPAFICQNSFEHIFRRLDIDPLFADIRGDTYQIDLEHAKADIGRADAVVLVHPFGLPADLDAWTDLCEDHDMVLIEDCVRALGAEYDGRPVGSFGRHAIYSLKKVSPVSIGGAIATDVSNPSEELLPPKHNAHAVYHLLPDETKNELSIEYPDDAGRHRLDEITSQKFNRFLQERFEDHVEETRKKAVELKEALKPLGFKFQPHSGDRTYFTTPATVPEGIDRDELVSYVNANREDSYVGALWTTPWSKSYAGPRYHERYPETSRLSNNIICFRTNSMGLDDVEPTVELIRSFLASFA